MTTIAQAAAPACKPVAAPDTFSTVREDMSVSAWIVLAGILAAAWIIRARNFAYSTAYMDEALYIEYGRMFLARHYQWPMDHPLRWTWGWYLWPSMAAFADSIGGLAAVRAVAAALGVVTVTGVFGFARKLFSPVVGLASAAVFALLGPAVFSSRIASRDCASIPFFALGLWAYAAAWKENKWYFWLAAGSGCFAAFLCKYVVAIYFPVLVLLAMKKGIKPLLLFYGPLTLASAFYLYFYRVDLAYLVDYGRHYHQLAIQDWDLIWENYVTKRADLWILFVLSLVALPLLEKKNRWKGAFLFLAGCLFLVFQWRTRADRDFWKHATYPLLFFTPLPMAGVVALARRSRNVPYQVPAFVSTMVLALTLGWAGSAWSMEETQNWASRAVWPDADAIVTYLNGRLSPESRVLSDDDIFGYYLQPPLDQSHVTNPFFLKYKEMVGDPAYVAAVEDGYFDYIAFDSGVGEEAQHMHQLLGPVLGQRYKLRLQLADAVLGHPLQVYERADPSPVPPQAATGPQVQILSPKTGDVAPASQPTELRGEVTDAEPGWYVRVEVYTNRWYPQGTNIALGADGSFSANVYFGGEGQDQCHHMVRAQLFNRHGRRVAMTSEVEIARANPDGDPPACR